MSLIHPIKIQITSTEINQLIEALADMDTNTTSPWHAAVVSVLQLVIDKLLKKQIAKRHDLHPFKVEFQYFEAYFLKEYLLKYNALMCKYYIQHVINKLDQKLA